MPSPLDRFKRPKAQRAPFLRAEDANALPAEVLAQTLGLELSREGRHYELGNGMRGTDKQGRLVWCHKDGTGIGDNCALAQAVTGLAFRGALELLLGSDSPTPRPVAQIAPVARLTLPEATSYDRHAGRRYLLGRGVSQQALELAEQAGFLAYCPGGVLFVGRDEAGAPRTATRRGYLPSDPAPKRDLKGSDKANWPGVIPGDSSVLWVVEGGVSALALLTQSPSPVPTVIVTGGVHVRGWLSNPRYTALLAQAKKVVIAGEREQDEATQARTDAARQRLIEALNQQQASRVEVWMPPEGLKDLGEMLTSAATLASSFTKPPQAKEGLL